MISKDIKIVSKVNKFENNNIYLTKQKALPIYKKI